MTTGGMVLGIIGGVVALITGIVNWTIGAFATAVGGGGEFAVLGFLTFILAIVGVVGGGMAKAKPKVAGILMLIAGCGGFSFIWMSYFWIFPGVLLIIGGILTIAGRKEVA